MTRRSPSDADGAADAGALNALPLPCANRSAVLQTSAGTPPGAGESTASVSDGPSQICSPPPQRSTSSGTQPSAAQPSAGSTRWLMCVSKRRTSSLKRTTRPEPAPASHVCAPVPWHCSQTRLPLPHVHATVPLTQSGQGIVSPEPGATGAHCADGGSGTPY